MIVVEDLQTGERFNIPVAISLEYTFFRLSIQNRYKIVDIKMSAFY